MTRLLVFACLVLGLVASCARPEPPTVKPEGVRIMRVAATGIDVVARVTATNPNAFDLAVRSVRATIRLDTGAELGPVVVPQTVSLPAKRPTIVEVPLSLSWENVVAVTEIAALRSDVAFELIGMATVGGETLNAEIPFAIRGVLRKEDIVRAGLEAPPPVIAPLPRGMP